MDTNSIYQGHGSIYQGHGLREKNIKIINKSFYTEKIKDTDEHKTVITKLKKILNKKLL